MKRIGLATFALASHALAEPTVPPAPAPTSAPTATTATTSPPAPSVVAAPAAPPAPPAPAAVPAPAPAAPPPAPLLQKPPGPTTTPVHFGVNYPGAHLEGRDRVDDTGWQSLCAAPCDRPLRLEGLDLRVTAPGMTNSNSFVIQPGSGTARLRVVGGSATARQIGIISLVGGLVVSGGGMASYALGSVNDERWMRTTGIVGLSVGAVAVLVALPLLFAGGTSVKDGRGRTIASTGGFVF